MMKAQDLKYWQLVLKLKKMNIKILILTVVLLSISADLYSQKKVIKVGKDTLFFKYDTNFL